MYAPHERMASRDGIGSAGWEATDRLGEGPWEASVITLSRAISVKW